ncbi:MAG: hypothetical protein QXW06_00580, partial [Thermoplasmata archaeon]
MNRANKKRNILILKKTITFITLYKLNRCVGTNIILKKPWASSASRAIWGDRMSERKEKALD